jgi:hypothetical protein
MDFMAGITGNVLPEMLVVNCQGVEMEVDTK